MLALLVLALSASAALAAPLGTSLSEKVSAERVERDDDACCAPTFTGEHYYAKRSNSIEVPPHPVDAEEGAETAPKWEIFSYYNTPPPDKRSNSIEIPPNPIDSRDDTETAPNWEIFSYYNTPPPGKRSNSIEIPPHPIDAEEEDETAPKWQIFSYYAPPPPGRSEGSAEEA